MNYVLENCVRKTLVFPEIVRYLCTVNQMELFAWKPVH